MSWGPGDGPGGVGERRGRIEGCDTQGQIHKGELLRELCTASRFLPRIPRLTHQATGCAHSPVTTVLIYAGP